MTTSQLRVDSNNDAAYAALNETSTSAQFVTASGTLTMPNGTGTIAAREVPANTHVLYVSKAGNDTTGDGSFSAPFLTVQKGIDTIGTQSTTSRWLVSIGPGRYSEYVKLNKSYTTLRGAGQDITELFSASAAQAATPGNDYHAALQIYTGTLWTSHASDTALAAVVVENMTIKNQPASDDFSVFSALCVGDYLYALNHSVVDAPINDILVRNCRIVGRRDTLTMVARGSGKFMNCAIDGSTDLISLVGASGEFHNCRIENVGTNNVTFLAGSGEVLFNGCVILSESTGTYQALAIRPTTVDTTAHFVVNVAGCYFAKSGSPSVLTPMVAQTDSGIEGVFNIGPNNVYQSIGHTNDVLHMGTMTYNFVGAGQPSVVMGEQIDPGNLVVRGGTDDMPTNPQVIIETLSSMVTNKPPQLVTRYSGLNAWGFGADPDLDPATDHDVGLGEWVAQTYQSGTWNTSASLRAIQSATAGPGDTPGAWIFATCADGSSTLTDRMLVNSDGTVTIGPSVGAANSVTLSGTSITFEGSSADTNETFLTATNPTADRTVTIPDASGTVVLTASSPTLTQLTVSHSISAGDVDGTTGNSTVYIDGNGDGADPPSVKLHDNFNDTTVELNGYNGGFYVKFATVQNLALDVNGLHVGAGEFVQGTLGSAVQTLKSTATNDDPTEIVYQGRTTSTDGSNVVLITIPTSTSHSYFVDVTLIGRRTGGSSGTDSDTSAFKAYGTFKNNSSGVLAQVSSTTAPAIHEANASTNVIITSSGTNILVYGTGVASNNYVWHATARVYVIGT